MERFNLWCKNLHSKCPNCSSDIFSYHDVPCKLFIIQCCNNAKELFHELDIINDSKNEKFKLGISLSEIESKDSTELGFYILSISNTEIKEGCGWKYIDI